MSTIALNPQSQAYIRASFCALADALFPEKWCCKSPSDADVMSVIDALDHFLFVRLQFCRIVIPLSYSTAVMLDAAATQLVNAQQLRPLPQSLFPGGRMFTFLSREDRLRTLQALENATLDLYLLPSPYQNNAGLVKQVTEALTRFSTGGRHSEQPA